MSLNDFAFFVAIDMMVREARKEFETRLLPTFMQATTDTGVPVVPVPLEGYYGETEELGQVLMHWRALQNNYSDTVTDAVSKLHGIFSQPAFGVGPSRITAINQGVGVIVPPGYDTRHAVISPMWDMLGIATQEVYAAEGVKGWTMRRIMEQTEKNPLGSDLVSLAIIVDQTYKRAQPEGIYNPVATAMGAETTVGSREFGAAGYTPIAISPEVYDVGMRVITAYNLAFGSAPEGDGLAISDETEAIEAMVEKIDFNKIIGRCVRIGTDPRADPPEHYHWAIVPDERDGPDWWEKFSPDYFTMLAAEFTHPSVVTTAEFRPDPDEYVVVR